MAFQIAAAMVRGTSHWRSHTPCQDAADVGIRHPGPADDARSGDPTQHLVVGAVADGGGSRVLSQIGARLVVSLAKASMAASWTAARLNRASPEALQAYWRLLFEDCRTAITDEARLRSANAEQPLAPGDFATTLIAFMATRDRLAAAQVGDGFLVYRKAPTATSEPMAFELLFQNRETEEASQVVWITAARWEADFRAQVIDGPLDMVIASSDGIEQIVLAPSDRDPGKMEPHQRFFSKLHAELQDATRSSAPVATRSDGGLSNRLTNILSDPELDRWVDDDKSAALAFWTEGERSKTSEIG